MTRSHLAMPTFVAPQVPILSPEPPTGSGWIHEIKHDGFRTLIRIDRGQVRALTRGGHDWLSLSSSRRSILTSLGTTESVEFCSAQVIPSKR